MRTHFTRIVLATLCLGCGQAPSSQAADPAPVAAAAPPAAAPPAPPAPAAVAALPEVPAGAKVFFVTPADGATAQGPLENGKVSVHVEMGASGIAIKPAGLVEAGSGHHHIVIDGEALPAGTVVPKDEQHLHFGKAQTEASVPLAPGPHSLTLQLGDGIHRSYGPALAASIKLTVVASGTVGAQPAPAPATH